MNTINLRSNTECTSMEDMRSKFITLCEQKEFVIDRTCIKQDKEDRDCGVMVGYKDKEIVVAARGSGTSKRAMVSVITICRPRQSAISMITYWRRLCSMGQSVSSVWLSYPVCEYRTGAAILLIWRTRI